MKNSNSLRQVKGTRLWDRKGATLMIVALAVSALMVTTLRAVLADGSGSSKIEAQLSGAMLNGLIPKGESESESFTDGSSKFEIEVENVNLPDGTMLNVLVDGTKVGTLTLALHRGQLELRTGNGATLPQINSRTRIVITNAAGATILAGAFSNIPPSPSPTATGTPGATPTPTPNPTPRPTVTPNVIDSALTGAAIGGVNPKGNAELETKANGDRNFEVEVEDVNLADNTLLNVLVDGTNVGTLTLSLHRGQL